MRRFGPHLLVLLLALGLLWGFGIFSKVTAPTTTPPLVVAVDTAITTQSNPLAKSKGQKSDTVSTEKLSGAGLTLKEWIEQIGEATALPVKWATPDLQSWAQAIHVSGYNGDAEISIADAFDIVALRHIKITYTDAKDALIACRFSNEEILWNQLTSSIDTNGSEWGTLRPWRMMQFKAEQSFSSALLLAGESAIEDAPELVLDVMGGLERVTAEIGGPLRWEASLYPDDVQSKIEYALLQKQSVPSDEFGGLGRITTIEKLEALVKKLESTKDRPLLQAAILTAIGQIEFKCRQMDSKTLGDANFELRRSCLAKVRDWMSTYSLPKKCSDQETLCAAAWLKLSQALFPEPTISEQAKSIQTQLAQSNLIGARYVAAEFEGAKALELLPPLTQELALASVAGPRWMRYKFSLSQAQGLLASANRRDVQAALWCLNQPTALREEQGAEPEVLQGLIAQLRQIGRKASSSILREKALSALYRERSGAKTGSERKSWRLYTDSVTAFEAFEKDISAEVQTTAAEILTSVMGLSELEQLSQMELSERSPAALEKLLAGLHQRVSGNSALSEDFAPMFYKLAEHLLQSLHEAVVAKAAWVRVQDPAWNLEKRIRLVRSLHLASARVAALQGLEKSISKRDELTPKMAQVLLADEDAQVRLASLKFLQSALRIVSADIIEPLKAAAEKDASAEVRAAATELLPIAVKAAKKN